MAKKKAERKTDDVVDGTAGQVLNDTDETDAGQVATEETDAPAADDVEPETGDGVSCRIAGVEIPVRNVAIEVTTAPIDPDAYLGDHVDGRLTLEQRRGLQLALNGATASAARLKSGRFVQTRIDAVRLVLERIDAAVDAGE